MTQCLRTLLSPDPEATAAGAGAGAGASKGAAAKASRAATAKAVEAQREFVKGLILDLCVAAVHKREDAERVALRMDDVERTAVVIRSLFLIDRELGLWILDQVRCGSGGEDGGDDGGRGGGVAIPRGLYLTTRRLRPWLSIFFR